MYRLLMISDNSEHVRELSLGLAEGGFLCSIVCAGDASLKDAGALSADLVVVAIDGAAPGAEVRKLPKRLKEGTRLPVVTLLSSKSLDVLDAAADVDDFVMEPWDTVELIARVKRILNRRLDSNSKDTISCGEVTIDPSKCEVSFRGRPVDLTFREYELLRFLVGNKGKVFSRDALLDKVWGYDFYGGDRTVDVHVRRLRSKLDESDCIETVRNIGYRFRDDA